MTGHRRYLQMIETHFAGELAEPERHRLFDHLRQCDACRAEFDAAAIMLRSAADREPTRGELDGWQDRLRTALDAPVAAEAPRPAWSVRLVPLAAVMVVVLVALGVWVLAPRPPAAPNLQLRGGDGGVAHPLVDIEIFAVAGAPPRPRILDDGDTVRTDEYLQFRYRNHSTRVRRLYLVGVDSDGRLLDYYPRPDQSESISVQEALSPLSVGRSIRLEKRHRAGELSVVGLFSEHPLRREVVHGKLQGLKRSRISKALFGEGVYVVVHNLRVTPSVNLPTQEAP